MGPMYSRTEPWPAITERENLTPGYHADDRPVESVGAARVVGRCVACLKMNLTPGTIIISVCPDRSLAAVDTALTKTFQLPTQHS